MPRSPDYQRLKEGTLLLLILALLLFASPLTLWWASIDGLWLLPYLLWSLVILLAAWLRRRFGQHDL